MSKVFKVSGFVFFIIFNSFSASAQGLLQIESKDSVEKENISVVELNDDQTSLLPEGNNRRYLIRGVIPSAALILAGVYTMKGSGIFSSYDLFDYRSRAFPNFSTDTDDFVMLAPLVALYSINFISESSRHTIPRQTLLLLASGVVTSALVWPSKVLTDIERPNGENHAFPSGHTAYAFTIATFMDKEFRNKRPWISIASYTIASATGILRVLNNAHWMSDVLAGAGVGILSVNTVYWIHGKLSKGGGNKVSYAPFFLPTGQSGLSLTIKL